MKFLLFFILVGLGVAQHPHNWTPSTQEPSKTPILDCSARDASESALVSCTSHWDTWAKDHPAECRDLHLEQGRFSTCTSASSTPSLTTITILRETTEPGLAPRNIKAAYTSVPTTPDNSVAQLLGPPDPVFKAGFPTPDCPGKSPL